MAETALCNAAANGDTQVRKDCQDLQFHSQSQVSTLKWTVDMIVQRSHQPVFDLSSVCITQITIMYGAISDITLERSN